LLISLYPDEDSKDKMSREVSSDSLLME